MVDEIKKYLDQLLRKVDGLRCILITDRDGVPVCKVFRDYVPENAMRPAFVSTCGIATDQASKLGLGKNKSLVCMYSKYQVVHISKLPLVITFIATAESNTGFILALEKQFDPLITDLQNTIIET